METIARFALALLVPCLLGFTIEHRWTHTGWPDGEVDSWGLYIDGVHAFEVPASDVSYADGVYSYRYPVPLGAAHVIQLDAYDADTDTASALSAGLSYDGCRYLDTNGDGLLGGADFTVFWIDFQAGNASGADFTTLYRCYNGLSAW